MKKTLGVGLLLLAFCLIGKGQSKNSETIDKPFIEEGQRTKNNGLTVLPDSNALHLIEDIFIGSTCFDISNASLGGSFGQAGTFSGGQSSIGIKKGLMISTGHVSNAEGPNGASNTGTSYNDLTNDPDLSELSGGSSFQDVAVIEFDFIPTLSEVSFEYVFASEEFCEFVNFDFNDLFGFFISGPGINGPFSNNAENIALIPQSDTYVSINTINHLLNSEYYINNIPLSQGQSCNNEEGQAVDDVAFDGFTSVLKATAEVIPCEIYHIKIVVGDRGDDRYDSAVFLKGNSFAAGSDVTTLAGVSGVGPNEIRVYEGCNDGFFLFERHSTNLDDEVVVHFSISNSSTAVAGEDYIAIPDSIIIPSGEATFRLPVTVLEDNIEGETDVLTIELSEACNCEGGTASLNIYDAPDLELFLSDATVCDGNSITVAPLVFGGVPGYSYEWGNGSTDPSFVINNAEDNITLNLTVTDDCNQEISGNATISTILPIAELSGTGIVCDGHPADSLQINLVGTGPFQIIYTLNDQPDTLNNVPLGTFELPVTEVGNYELTSVSSSGCLGEVSGQAEIVQHEILIDLQDQQVSCYEAEDGMINLDVSGGTMPYAYEWNLISENQEDLSNLDTGFYQVSVTDLFGCIGMAETTIAEPNALSVDLLNVVHVDCAIPTGSITVAANGGTGDLTYNWNTTQNADSIFDLPPGVYELILNDENECEVSLTAIVEDRVALPTVNVAVNDTLDCVTDQVLLNAQASSQGANFEYQWVDPNNQTIADSLYFSTSLAGEYQLVINNTFNQCQDTAVVEVISDHLLPIADAGVADSITCLAETLTLNTNNSSQGNNYTYSWRTTDGNITVGGESLEATINAEGMYILDVFNENNGCLSSDSVLITENSVIPVIEFGVIDTVNCFDPNIEILATGSGSSPNFNYEWNTPDGQIISVNNNETIIVDQGGTYILEITDQSNGCKQIDSVNVIANQVYPIAIAGPDLQLNCAYPTLQIQASQSSNGPNFDISWNTIEGAIQINDQSLSPTIDQVGIFELQLLDQSNGCITQDTVAVTEFFETPTVQIEGPDLLTCQDSVIALHAENSSQGAPFLYLWTSPDGHILNGENSLSPNIDAIGAYQLLITHQESACSDSAMVIISQDFSVPNITIETPNVLDCNVQASTLNASTSGTNNNLDYLWYSDQGNITGIADSSSVMIDHPGEYFLLLTNNENGCSTTESVVVTENVNYPVVDAGANQHLDCAITSALLDGTESSSGSTFEYLWYGLSNQISPVPDTNSLLVSEAGDYVLVVSNTTNNCISFDTVNVSVDTLAPLAEAGITDSINCIQANLLLDGSDSSTGPTYTYQWISQEGHPVQDETSLEPTVSNGGLYQLIVLNTENNCSASDEVNIAIDTLQPILAIDAPGAITCSQSSLMLQANVSSGTDFSFSWQSMDGLILENADSPTPLIGSSGQYNLMVSNVQNGCTAQASTLVVADTIAPIANAGTEAVLNCQISTLTLDGTQSSAGNVTYLWNSLDGNILSGENTMTPLVGEAATYVLLVSNLDNGCQNLDSVFISLDDVAPESQILQPNILTCNDTLVSLNGVTAEDNPGFLFQWTDEMGNALSTANSATISIDSPGLYHLEVVNPENHCSDNTSVIVLQDITPPIADAGSSVNLNCLETSVTLNGQASSSGPQFNYLWSSQNGHIIDGASSLQVVVDDPGLYSLRVENTINGCNSEAEVDVFAAEAQEADIAVSQPECQDDLGSIQISNVTNGTAPFLYSIDGGEQFFSEASFNQLDPGEYAVVVQDLNGCLYEEDLSVLAPPALNLSLPEQLTIKLGESLQLQPQLSIPRTEIQNFSWSPTTNLSCTDCLEPYASPQTNTNYRLHITTLGGCHLEAKIDIIVDKRHSIYIPNAFSPYNQDGINDKLVIYAKDNAVKEIIKMHVFNRWGEQVFFKENFLPNDPQLGWDGARAGQLLRPGVYVYWIEIEMIDGQSIMLKGDVTLVK